MHSRYLFLVAILLALAMSDLSRYCRHHVANWKFRTSIATAASNNMNATRTDTGVDADWRTDADAGHDMLITPTAFDTAALLRAELVKDTALNIAWSVLRDVKYKRKYNEEHEMYFDYPVFGERIQALAGKKVRISGYLIPLGNKMFALSKNPYAACFFCGGAGPETVMALVFKKIPNRLNTDDYLTLSGVLHLNDTDVENFMYQLLAVQPDP